MFTRSKATYDTTSDNAPVLYSNRQICLSDPTAERKTLDAKPKSLYKITAPSHAETLFYNTLSQFPKGGEREPFSRISF